MPRRLDLNGSLTDEQRQRLADATMSFLNDPVIRGHMKIDHVTNFFIDHRGYIQLLEEALRAGGHADLVPLPGWDPVNDMPQPFWRCKGMDGGVDFDVPTGPAWIPLLNLPTPVNLRTPCTFTAVDDLARALGRTFELDPHSYHADSHRNVGPPMYDMMTAASATIFWPMHAFFEEMYTTWEACNIAPARSLVALETPAGDNQIFVIGKDGGVWRSVQRLRNPGRWSHWLSVGGSAFDELVGAVNVNGRQELFAQRGFRIFHTSQKQADVDNLVGAVPTSEVSQNPQEQIGWHDWTERTAPFIPVQLVTGRDKAGRLNLFVVAKDSTIWNTHQTEPNGTQWTDWLQLDTSKRFNGVVAANHEDGRLVLFGLEVDRTAWHVSERQTDGLFAFLRSAFRAVVNMVLAVFGVQRPPALAEGWGSWASFDPGNQQIDGLSAGRTRDGRLMVFGVTRSSALLVTWQRRKSSSTWVTWEALGVDGDQVAVTNTGDGELAVFVLSGNTILHNISMTSGGFQQWIDLAASGVGPRNVHATCAGNGALDALAIGEDGMVHNLFQRTPADSTAPWSMWNIV